MKKIKIIITITGDSITLDGENLPDLTENDIIDSIKMLIALNKTLSFCQEGAKENGDA